MRYQDLRRPRGIESLWLRLRLAFARFAPGPSRRTIGNLSALSDRQLEDIGLERSALPGESASFWRIRN